MASVMRKKYPSLWKLRQRLGECWPLGYPVRVVVVEERPWFCDNFGDCSFTGTKSRGKFLIRISKDHEYIMIESLLHEWAHGIIWWIAHPAEHPPAFYAQYGELDTWFKKEK